MTARLLLVLCASAPLFAQVSVPFVGCVSFGQTGDSPAPKSTNKSVSISPKDAQGLAYYTSGGAGVLAPRGWSCQGAWGSGGSDRWVGPKPIGHDRSQHNPWQGLDGPSIQLNHISVGASGRWDAAEIMVRDFPAYRAFGRSVLMYQDGPIPTGPYPRDTLKQKSNTVVEFTTPAQTEGLGNHASWIGKNDLPITGAAILANNSCNSCGPDVVIVSVRLPPDLQHLIPAIVGEVERETPPPAPPK